MHATQLLAKSSEATYIYSYVASSLASYSYSCNLLMQNKTVTRNSRRAWHPAKTVVCPTEPVKMMMSTAQ